ncbi:MAG: hypothetical protein PHY12_01315 [Eubacteriales bacterium]|nr:hypothetical protein [Eubacteriales bacterium]
MKGGSRKSVGPVFFTMPFILFLVLSAALWLAVHLGYAKVEPMLTLVRLAVKMP